MSAAEILQGPQAAIQACLRRIAAEVRRRRAERGALRGAFWGAVAAAAVLAAKGQLGDLALPIALTAVGLCTLAGAVLSAIHRVTPLEAARLADRAFGLHDRVATTLECAAAPQRNPLADALVADTEARLQAIEPRRIVRRITPPEARLVVVPLLIAVVLAWAPPIPGPVHWWPEGLGSRKDVVREDPSAPNALETSAQALAQERAPSAMANAALNAAGKSQSIASGQAETFKDKTLAKRESDFANFIKKGDDRLRMLEHADRLPDLQTDTSTSQYKKLMRSAGNLSANPRASGLSPERLGKLLRELADLGRKNNDFGNEVSNGLEALDEGRTDDAFQALQSALEKLREAEDRRRNAKGLSSSPDETATQEAGGKSAGQGSDRTAKGPATSRLRSTPYTVGLQGLRSGRPPSLETRITGRAGAMESQLQYLGVIGEYQKMAEESITREQVPRDYQGQVRNYFKALGER